MGTRTTDRSVEVLRSADRAAVGTWICVVVGTVTLINVAASSSFDGSGRSPFVLYSGLWLWAAYRLRRHGRAWSARTLSVVSLCVAGAAVVGTMAFLVSWSDLGSVRVSLSGVVQLVVPILGAVGVLLTTRRS